MVNTKDIINKLLMDFGKITPDEAVEIQKTAKEYPFFQQAFLFRTLYLKKSGSFYKTALQETAARTTDRRRLYEIIELGEMPGIPKEENIDKKEIDESSENFPDEMKQKESGTIPKKKKENSPENNLKKKQINISESGKKNAIKKKIEKNKTQPGDKTLSQKETGPKKQAQSSKKTEENKKKEVEYKKSFRKLSYLEWLKQVNSAKKQENKEIFDAIDKFLKERPKIVPKKENSAETPAIIEKSLEEKQSLMTETLANLYVKQKKYDKAIQAFKILSLKYPKKSSYFANRIKELKQKLK